MWWKKININRRLLKLPLLQFGANIILHVPCRLPLFVEVFSSTLEFQPELKAKQLPWIGLKNCVNSLKNITRWQRWLLTIINSISPRCNVTLSNQTKLECWQLACKFPLGAYGHLTLNSFDRGNSTANNLHAKNIPYIKISKTERLQLVFWLATLDANVVNCPRIRHSEYILVSISLQNQNTSQWKQDGLQSKTSPYRTSVSGHLQHYHCTLWA